MLTRKNYLIIFINVLYITARATKAINNNRIIKQYTKYCEAYQRKYEQKDNYELTKLIIFHNKCEYTPDIIAGTSWNEEICKKCEHKSNTISKCENVECKNSMPTSRGYDKVWSVAEWIKEKYKIGKETKMYFRSVFNPINIAVLHAFYNGITGKLLLDDVIIKEKKEDEFVLPDNCPYLQERTNIEYFNKRRYNTGEYEEEIKNQVNNNNPEEFQIKNKQDLGQIYLSAMCKNIRLDCENINCDIIAIEDIIQNTLKGWKDMSEQIAEDQEILKYIFGVFVAEILKIIDNDSVLNIISIPSSSLQILLSGFGTKLNELLPLSSGFFIEIWVDKEHKGKKDNADNMVVRLIYNDVFWSTNIDLGPNISYIKFFDFLKSKQTSIEERSKKCNPETEE